MMPASAKRHIMLFMQLFIMVVLAWLVFMNMVLYKIRDDGSVDDTHIWSLSTISATTSFVQAQELQKLKKTMKSWLLLTSS